ncbi:MAG: hypothetical protein LBN42_00335, partial [Oscillospiraceae bacterium]|nr:hypothetical protein [Oscillospiraceae bacterium]
MENIENIEVHSAKLPGKFDFWRIVGKVYKNFWTRQIVGFSSIWYLLFIFGVAKDFYTHIITFTNPVSLFALYLMVNLFFCLLMFYSRLSIATQICSFLLHPCILVLFIMTDFSNYFAILPPLIVSTFILCFSKANETTKTVFFTLYAVMFVCAVIGFKVMAIFKITVPLMPPDYSMRSDDYLYSPDRHYRIVMYIDPPETENRTAMYY